MTKISRRMHRMALWLAAAAHWRGVDCAGASRRYGVHRRQIPGRGPCRQRRSGQDPGARRRPAGGLPVAAEAAGAGYGLSSHPQARLRQGRRPDRRLQGPLGAQLRHRIHRQPRLLLPVESRARSAAPRGHPLLGRAGAGRSPSFPSGATDRPARRATIRPGPTSGRGSTSSTRSPRSPCRRCARRSSRPPSARWPAATARRCARSPGPTAASTF